MLREAKKMGKVRIVACSLVADMLGLKKDDFDASWWRGWGRDVPGRGRDLWRSALHL